ncbi:unnamed protein product [Timema podura]|uniref:Uncharacterized protein n=1 Tax=Timema podura TaxID=61482 RepID=A0ABN7NI29_TIMPD|nr:unnamed protein product [Timema podura]
MEINATIETNGNLFGDGFRGSGSLEESSLSDDRDQTCIICRSSDILFHSSRSLQTSPSATHLQSSPVPFQSISPDFSLSHTSPVFSSSIPVDLSRLLPQPHFSSPLL